MELLGHDLLGFLSNVCCFKKGKITKSQQISSQANVVKEDYKLLARRTKVGTKKLREQTLTDHMNGHFCTFKSLIN